MTEFGHNCGNRHEVSSRLVRSPVQIHVLSS
jgi:hypothetical protein